MIATASETKGERSAQFVAGATAGTISRFCVAPLDVVKIRLQVQLERGTASKYTGVAQALRTIVTEEGFVGLWRGNLMAEFLWAGYSALQFGTFATLRELAKGEDGNVVNCPIHILLHHPLVSGGIAGAVATLGTYPLDLARTRFAAQGIPKIYPSIVSLVSSMYSQGGVRSFYQGLSPTLVGVIPFIALQFWVYESLKQLPENNNSLTHAVAGAFAGFLPKLVVHPVDVVKKRMQMQGVHRHTRYGSSDYTYRGVTDCVSKIAKHEGLRGFYKGLVPNVLKAAPASAITFVVYEKIASILLSPKSN
eukprot:GILK01005995.1.p1 GENE.GILK01005995.1~~GILK01005995.1.p1  ORF type:complete len:307 (+),score=8.59 GILK01005995.1:64-984(+)